MFDSFEAACLWWLLAPVSKCDESADLKMQTVWAEAALGGLFFVFP
jgi:hypothetical protein